MLWYALLAVLLVIALLAEVMIGAVHIPLSAIGQLLNGGAVEKGTMNS